MDKFMTATEARKNFYAVINAAGKPGVSVAITHEGVPKVVVMSFEEFEGWQETMEIMADPQLMRDIREAMKEKETVPLEQLERSMLSTRHVRRRSQTKGRKAI